MANFTARYPGQGGGGSSGGVTSLNSETGDITLVAGTGIQITPSGQNITIASTSAGDVTIGAFGSTPNANGLSISGSQVLNMQPASGSAPGGVSITSQIFAGNKFFNDDLYISDGTNSLPGIAFSSDQDTGIYRIGANDMAFAAGSFSGLEIKKSTGNFANVGMGSAPSASDNYPVLIQRSNVSTGTYMQISNPDTSASSKATYQLSADSGGNTGELSLFTAATGTAAYAGSLVLRPSDSTLRLSLIGGDLSTGYVTTYTGGDYTSTGETARFNADHTMQFMQSVTAPTSPSAGLLFYNNAGIFSSKTTGGTVSSFSGVNTGNQTITLIGDVTGSGTGSFATTYAGTVPVNKGGTGQITAAAAFNALSPITTTGDMIYSPSGATSQRLAIGSTGNALMVSGGVPTWGTLTIAGGGTGQTTKAPAFDALSPMSAGGDLIYGGASGTGTRLANGSAGQVLTSAGGTAAPAWGDVGVPTGTVVMFGAASAPTGWILCDGSSLLRAGTYAALFAVIGTTYGSADGTHFNAPNAQGVFVRGAGSQTISAISYSGSLGTAQGDQFQSHKHATADTTTFGVRATGAEFGAVGGSSQSVNLTGVNTDVPKTDGSNGTPRTGSQTYPANLCLTYIIKI